MSSSIRITLGLTTSAVTTGLAKLRGQFHEFRDDVNSEFSVGKFLAVGAIVEGLRSVMEAAGKFADLSARFGVGAEGLQRIGNAAAQDGVEIEGVAAAMNKAVVAQGKVREGSAEMMKALQDLGISATDFVNLDPEEAFYAVADGVAASDDPTKAYNATLQLLGKSAGALIPTLQKGSAEIRNVGDAAGVMSEDTVALLDEVGDKLGALMNRFKVLGAQVIGVVFKSTESIGAWAASAVAKVKYAFGAISKEERDFAVQAAQETMDDIWAEKKPEEKAGKKHFDVEETEQAIKSAEELQKLYDKIAEQKRQAVLDQLDGESRINELIKERDQLYTDAAAASDPAKQAEMWIKAGEVEKNLMQERDKVAKEYESRQERIAKARQSYEKKQFDAEMEGKSEDEKLKALETKRNELAKKIADESDEEKLFDLLGEKADLEKEMLGMGKKKADESVVASSLTKIGGGGAAFLSKKDPNVERTAKATEKAAEVAEKSLKELRTIKDKVGKPQWNP